MWYPHTLQTFKMSVVGSFPSRCMWCINISDRLNGNMNKLKKIIMTSLEYFVPVSVYELVFNQIKMTANAESLLALPMHFSEIKFIYF